MILVKTANESTYFSVFYRRLKLWTLNFNTPYLLQKTLAHHGFLFNNVHLHVYYHSTTFVSLVAKHPVHRIEGNAYSQKRNSKQISRSEFMALMGLIYFVGTMKSQHGNVQQLWPANGTGIQILRADLSYKRLLILLRCICFDNRDTRAERKKSVKLAAIRSPWDPFVQNCLKSYNKREFVTIDEKLHSFRGCCSWI